MKYPLLTCLGFWLAGLPPVGAVTLFQADHFQTTSQDWTNGSGVAVTWQSEAGPDGIGGHLRIVADGTSRMGRLHGWNDVQWLGDYVVAGITGITLWADNRSAAAPISLRLAFYNNIGGWFMTRAVTLQNPTAGADWQQITFDLTNHAETGLVHATLGTGDYATTMSGVQRVEILSAAGTPNTGNSPSVLQGDQMVGDLRIDGLVAIPEPGVPALLAGVLLLPRRRRWER